MASYTTNLNLKKPAGSENVAIGDINNNMDTIDQAYGTLNSNMPKIAVVTGTSADTVSGSILLDYPSGFERDNCVLIGLQYFDTNVWRTLGALNASEPCVLSAILQGGGINVVTRSASAASKNIKVTLCK